MESTSGDLLQHYDPADANPGLRVRDRQEPVLAAGYHHQWVPGSDTLFLYSRLNDTLNVVDPAQPIDVLPVLPDGSVEQVQHSHIRQNNYRSTFNINSIEAQHLWQTPTHHTVVGARFQWGDFATDSLLSDLERVGFYNAPPPLAQSFTTPFERATAYAYHSRQIVESLRLIAGLTYDGLKFPENFRAAPISDRQERQTQVSPKAGLIWTPCAETTVRAAYAQGLGGASFDQSFQLEPSQVAGFVQSFRSLLPESLTGSSIGESFETYGVSWENRFRPGTYLGVAGEVVNSQAERTLGVFEHPDGAFEVRPAQAREEVDFTERTLRVTLHQLAGREWAFGADYRLSRADLRANLAGIVPGLYSGTHHAATLHELSLRGHYQHPSGFFGLAEAVWNRQSNDHDDAALPVSDFWQLNLFAGYRFPNRRAEVTVGVLNLTDQDYRLNPVNLHHDRPHSRTFAAKLRFNF